jgi:hypothetical protein
VLPEDQAPSRTTNPVDVTDPGHASVIRRRRLLHRVITGTLALILLVAVLDGFDVINLLGPDEAYARASGGGYDLTVEHPDVTRPALASVFRIAVHKDGGFDDEVEVAISRHYLEIWDVNATIPAPDGETSIGDWVIWSYDEPPGDTLRLTYEARIEPGVQADRTGFAAVMEDEEPVVQVRFRTKVRP